MFRQDERAYKRAYTSMPKATAAKLLHAGNVRIQDYRVFVSGFKTLLKAKKETGAGSLRTSAVIMEVVVAALIELEGKDEESKALEAAVEGKDEKKTPEVIPSGGFTDTWVHERGEARDCAWFIFEAALDVLLGNHRLFRETVAQIRLWLTERHLASVVDDDRKCSSW